MKNYTFLPLLIVLLISFNSYSQNFAPVGAKWKYEIEDIYGNLNYGKWVSTKDTVILGKNAREIKLMNPPPPTSVTDTILFIYEDSGIVYKYLAITNTYTILYDFNANMGDSWVMDVDSNCSLTINVDSTSSELINGFNLKVLYVSTINDEFFSGKIIEKIGHQTTPLPSINFLCYNIIGGLNGYSGLRCYTDTIIGFYNTGISVNCDSNYTIGLEEQNKLFHLVNVYPNPSKDIINITSREYIKELQLLSNSGQLIQIFQLNNFSFKLNINKTGFYYLKIKTNDSVIYKKIIIN